mgnify:CR=1 FL=1
MFFRHICHICITQGDAKVKDTIEIRWHGRGGQGAKTAALLLADVAFKTGKYSDLVLKYLCENYTGPTDELINLWHAADKFSISSMKLDERILEQGIYTQIEPEKISDIFMEFEKLNCMYFFTL